MTRRAVRYVLFSQMSFVATVSSLVVMHPEALISRSGISYYGNFRETIVPYAAGLGLTGWFLVKAANSLSHRGRQAGMIRLALRVSAIALAGIIVTPSFASPFAGFWHGTFAALLFCTQAAVAWKLAASELWRSLIDRALLVIQALSIAAILLSFTWIAFVDVMIPAQAAAATAFGILCIRLIGRLQMADHSEQSAEAKQRVQVDNAP